MHVRSPLWESSEQIHFPCAWWIAPKCLWRCTVTGATDLIKNETNARCTLVWFFSMCMLFGDWILISFCHCFDIFKSFETIHISVQVDEWPFSHTSRAPGYRRKGRMRRSGNFHVWIIHRITFQRQIYRKEYAIEKSSKTAYRWYDIPTSNSHQREIEPEPLVQFSTF